MENFEQDNTEVDNFESSFVTKYKISEGVRHLWNKSGIGWIVVHNTHTGEKNVVTVINDFNSTKVGANYYIDYDGTIYKTADEDTRIIEHCGTSYVHYYNGKGEYEKLSNDLLDPKIGDVIKGSNVQELRTLNRYSVGIEVMSKKFEAPNPAQFRSLVKLCRYLQNKHPELKKGGIANHGKFMPNSLVYGWASKKECGKIALEMMRSSHICGDLHFAYFDSTPSSLGQANKLIADRAVAEKEALAKSSEIKSLTTDDFEEINRVS